MARSIVQRSYLAQPLGEMGGSGTDRDACAPSPRFYGER